MTALAWLALAAALVLLPVAEPAVVRARELAEHGRLATLREPPHAVPGVEAVAWLAWTAVTGSVTLARGPVLGLAAAIASAMAVRIAVGARRARAEARDAGELLSAVRLIAAELEAGAGSAAAFEAAARAGTAQRAAFEAAAEACRLGRDPPLDGHELRGLGQAWSVAAVTGAPMAAVIARVGDDLAARADQRRAVDAALAGARSSAALLAGLPVLGLLLGAAMQAHPLGILLGTNAGQVLCLVGVCFDAAGVLWTQRLAARAARP